MARTTWYLRLRGTLLGFEHSVMRRDDMEPTDTDDMADTVDPVRGPRSFTGDAVPSGGRTGVPAAGRACSSTRGAEAETPVFWGDVRREETGDGGKPKPSVASDVPVPRSEYTLGRLSSAGSSLGHEWRDGDNERENVGRGGLEEK